MKFLDRLERENRAGVPHYKSGQHRAYTMPPPDESHALLVYVDVMGHAVLMTCELRDGEWHPEGMRCRISASGLGHGWQAIPEDTELSQDSRDALAAATPFEG